MDKLIKAELALTENYEYQPLFGAQLINFNNNKKQRIYFLNYSVQGNFAVYCNEIPFIQTTSQSGIVEGLEYLNPLITEQGNQIITIIRRPSELDEQLSSKDLENNVFEIMYVSKVDDSAPKLLKRLENSGFIVSQDSMLAKLEFDAEITYSAQSFTLNAGLLAVDKPEILMGEVLAFYKNIHQILNDGDEQAYRNIFEKSFRREATSMYLDEIETENYIRQMVFRVKSAKGRMMLISDYKLNLGLNNRTVNLITSVGKSPLYAVDENKEIKTFGFKLFFNQEKNKLDIY